MDEDLLEFYIERARAEKAEEDALLSALATLLSSINLS
jgi:hypothetical protein